MIVPWIVFFNFQSHDLQFWRCCWHVWYDQPKTVRVNMCFVSRCWNPTILKLRNCDLIVYLFYLHWFFLRLCPETGPQKPVFIFPPQTWEICSTHDKPRGNQNHLWFARFLNCVLWSQHMQFKRVWLFPFGWVSFPVLVGEMSDVVLGYNRL